MNEVGQKVRESNDEFKPWENAILESKVYDRRSTFERAFERGTDETKAALGGALNYIGEMVGNDEWVEEGRQIARRHGVDAALNKRKFESVDQVEGFGDALDYVVETLGEAAPGLIVDALATAGTVAIGAATGGTGAAAGVGLMGAMRATAGRALMKGAKAGLYAGPALSGFVQSAGAMENRLDSTGEGEHSAASTLSGVTGAALNALPFVAVFGKSLKATGLSDEAAKPVLDALAKPSVAKRLKDVLGTTAIGAAAEGVTETAQVITDEIIATEVGDDEWRLETRDAVEAGIRAVIGGGAMGGIASTAGNTVGFMREYNQARKGADAEGETVDAEGWKADTVEEVEDDGVPFSGDDALEQSVERAAKKRPKSKPNAKEGDDEPSVVGQGQFDSLTARDVPNLSSDRYDELREILEPKGKPLSEAEIGALVDNGTLTDEELARYAADSHYGASTPLSGGYDKTRGDEALARVFKQVVRLSRDGKLKLTEQERNRLTEAEEESTDTALRAALGAINPEFNNIVYRNANQFDGRAMFRDYAKIKRDRVKNRERIKKEAQVEKSIENAPTVQIPKGEAPKEKPKGVVKSAPDWIKEGRKPSKEEVDEAMSMLDNAKDKLKVRIRSVIEGKGKNTQAARDIFAVEVAKNAKQLAEVGQHYDFESTGSIEADKLTLLNKIVDSSIAGTKPDAAKPKKKAQKPTTTEGKVEYLKRELGTRTASDGDMGKLLESHEQYVKFVKDGDAVDPAKLSDTALNTLKQREKFADNEAITKQIDELQARVDKFEFIQSFRKAVDSMYDETAATKSQRELGERTDQQVAYAERDENGDERNVGDVQSVVDTGDNDLEVAANYTRRTQMAERVYKELKKIKGMNNAALVKFMRETVKPTEREAALGDRLPKRTRKRKPIDNQKTTKDSQFDQFDTSKPLFTYGDQEKRPDTRHLSKGTVNRLKEHLENEDFEAFGKLLEKTGIMPKEATIGEAKMTPSERLASVARNSFASNKLYRAARARSGDKRSDRGLVVRDNESGKPLNVDLDAVTRWALREDKIDLNDSDAKVNEELATAVLSGISALAELRLNDGRPMFSFNLDTIRDSAVVYRVDGDKLASVTMGSIRNGINYKGKKRSEKVDVVQPKHVDREQRSTLRRIGIKLSDKPEFNSIIAAAENAVAVGDLLPKELVALTSSIEHNLRANRTLSDLMPEDIGNVYRDEVSYDDIASLIADSVNEGKITEERGDELLLDAKNRVFDKEYEQAAKDGGELTIKTQRIDDELANRDDVSTVSSTRGVLHKTKRKDKSNKKADNKSITRKGLEQDVSTAKEQLERAEKWAKGDMDKLVADAQSELNSARKRMSKTLVSAIRRGEIEGVTVAQLKEDEKKLLSLLESPTVKGEPSTKGTTKQKAENTGERQPVKNGPLVVNGRSLDAIRQAIKEGGVKGVSVAEMRNAHGDIDSASPALLKAVADREVRESKRMFVNKGDFGESQSAYAALQNAKMRVNEAKAIKARAVDSGREAEVRAALVDEARRKLEVAEIALKSYKATEVGKGTDMSKGRKIQLNRKLKKVVQRNRGLAKKSMFRFFEMTRTRLNRIHPEAAARADSFTSIQRNDTEYFASRIGKEVGNNKAIQKGYEDSLKKVKSPERDKYEAFISKLNTYVKKHDKNFKPVSSKVHLDLHAVERNREGFLSILREADVKNPESVLDSILDGRGYPEFAIRPELSNPPRSGRKVLEPLYHKLKEGGFADTDAPRHLLRLVNSSTSWAAWNQTHGGTKNGKWDSNAEFERIQGEVHSGNRQEFAKLYQGVTGRLGMNMSPVLRSLNSAALAFQSATVLWFTGLASVPEVAATYARMRGDTNGMLDDAKSVLTSVGREKMFKVARDFDIITDDAIEHSLQEMYNMNDLTMGRVSQSVQAFVFKYNGQNYVTKMTRAIATKAAERYLVRAVEDGADGEKRLKELGVTAADVKAFASDADITSPAGKRYRDAVHKFVNEAVTNPRSTQLPLVANDPRFLLVTTLKKFFYGFYDNVHKSLAKGFKDKSSSVDPWKAVAVTAAVALPLALVAELTREQIRYPFGRPKWQGERDIADWGGSVLAATGLLGPATMAESIYAGTTYGNHPVVAALGPTAQFAVDVATLEMQPSRVVPLANQIPWMAKPINESVKNLIK
ncbi:hypothetical protein [Pseudoalteromonas sp. Xi13]|uniref:hypothetical protein n=1 Tax=Pseudoalteromonas sp. Xi13 TaxID=2490635 RepID=UPI000F764846|nr:hypothetical protein [Pseudoalteromonas sp. Xi13]AZN32585.1 hypothetical protein EJ103_07560 [Pseudoalteromonas sp. Xi13]